MLEHDIGNWDMLNVAGVDVDVGVHYEKWRHICVMIRNDAGNEISRLGLRGTLSGWWKHDPAKGDNVLTLYRHIGGDYADAAYSATPYNRGYIRMVRTI